MNTTMNRQFRSLARAARAGLLCAGLLGGFGGISPALAQPARTQATAPTGVVNLNTASAAELQRLPGIGPRKAEAIIAARDRQGGFEHIRQIVFVEGIGRATFRRLQPMLTLQGETTLK